MGPANGVITDSAAILSVGSTIELLSAAGGPGRVDVDGDEDKAGAYCVWYKVPAGGGTPVLIQDNGPTDCNCQYTIQMSDVGFHIQNIIKIYSDADIAAAKGYTINPIESIATETLSATAVVAPYIKRLESIVQAGGKIEFAEKDGFPTVGYKDATFKVIIDDGAGKLVNNQYDWISSMPGEASVGSDGLVTLRSRPSGTINIEAHPKHGGPILTYQIKMIRWHMAPPPVANTAPPDINKSEVYCINDGWDHVARKEQLTTAKRIGETPLKGSKGMGTLYGEWGGLSANRSTYVGDNMVWNPFSGKLASYVYNDYLINMCYSDL